MVGELEGVHDIDSQTMPSLSPSRRCMSPLVLIIQAISSECMLCYLFLLSCEKIVSLHIDSEFTIPARIGSDT